MAIQVKIGAGESFIEHRQIEARLDALGLKLNPDNTIDEQSADNVAGGLQAIQALAKDGVIDADAVAQLRRQTTWFGSALGRDLPMSKKQSNAWRALVLDVGGAAKTLRTVNAEVSGGALSNSHLGRVSDRIETLQTRINELSALEPDLAQLALVEPEVLRGLGESSKALTDAATQFQMTLSSLRGGMLKALDEVHGPKYRLEPGAGGGYEVNERPGWWARAQVNALAGSMTNALEGLPTIARLGQLFSTPIGSADAFEARTAQVAQRGTDGPAAIAQSIVDKLGRDPGLFPGSVGPATAERLPADVRPTFEAVLHAAAEDMVGRREVSNAYGNVNTMTTAQSVSETEQTIPRDVFKAALHKTSNALAGALDGVEVGSAADVEHGAQQQLGADAHYLPAVLAMHRAMQTD